MRRHVFLRLHPGAYRRHLVQPVLSGRRCAVYHGTRRPLARVVHHEVLVALLPVALREKIKVVLQADFFESFLLTILKQLNGILKFWSVKISI